MVESKAYLPSLAKLQRRSCWLYNQGLISYPVALDWQRSLLKERVNNPSLDDVLILLEHPSVYTLGQGASLEFLKFNPEKTNWDIYRVERGGEVTYHCPGILVGYPILNLQYYRKDLHWYLRQLEEVIIQVLAVYGLKGDRHPGFTGVWSDSKFVEPWEYRRSGHLVHPKDSQHSFYSRKPGGDRSLD